MSHPTHCTATRADVCPSAHLGSHASASETHARLMDAAKAEADRLRHQAVCEFGSGVVDDFWRGAARHLCHQPFIIPLGKLFDKFKIDIGMGLFIGFLHLQHGLRRIPTIRL